MEGAGKGDSWEYNDNDVMEDYLWEYHGDSEGEPSLFYLIYLRMTDHVMFNFVYQRSNLRAQCRDLERQYTMLLKYLREYTQTVKPMETEFDFRLKTLKQSMDNRIRGKNGVTREEIKRMATPDEIEESNDLQLLQSIISTKKENITFIRTMIREVTEERIKRYMYLDSMRLASTLDDMMQVMDTMRDYDLTASAQRIVTLFNQYTKSTFATKPIDKARAKIDGAKNVVLDTRRRNELVDDILDLLLEEAVEEDEEIATQIQPVLS